MGPPASPGKCSSRMPGTMSLRARWRERLRGLRRRLHGDAVLCLIVLFGCPNGDFGRVRPPLVLDGIHDWVGRDAARGAGAPISQFPLTDDERLLRDLAFPLIEPPYDRQRWYSVLNEWGMTHYFRPEWWHCDETAYAARLMNDYARSETSRYFRLGTDIRNDVVRIEPFFAVALRVLDIDRKREKSLGFVQVLSDPEIANAQARIGENLLIVGWVQQSLAERATSYRFALERLIIAAPSQAAVEVERSISLLQTRIAAASLVQSPNLGPPPPPRRRTVAR
jgi:hypothetical protein